MELLNEELFLADYHELLNKKSEIESACQVEVDKLNASDDLKAKVLDLLVEEQTKNIESQIAFYEKYITKGED